MIQRTQEKAKILKEKSGKEKEKKGENVERQKQSSKKSNGGQESLQQDVEAEGAQTHGAKQRLRMESSSSDRNSYSEVVASIPPEFIFKPFQSRVELVYE